MLSKHLPCLTYANVVSSACLFIVLGGTSYAVATGSIGSREIKDNSIRSKDIRNNDVRSKDVRNSSLLAKDFKAGQLPRGLQGAAGPRGPEGPPAFDDSVRETATSAMNSSDAKEAIAECPEGTVVLGGGYNMVNVVAPDINHITVTDSSDWGAFAGREGGGWVVRASESAPVANQWAIEASAICG